MEAEQQKTYWHIDRLYHWDKNPRSITPEDRDRLIFQIKALGQYKPLIVTNDGEVLGGNMRLDVYKELGISDIWVSIVDAPTDAKKLEYALSDNDRAGSYEEQKLAELIQELGAGIDLEKYKVDLNEAVNLAKVLEDLKETKEDEPPAVDNENEPVSKLGEVYQLGRHRLMCGDSTKIEDAEKLMNGQKVDMVFTDPPYGVSYGDKNAFLNTVTFGKRIQEGIENDSLSLDEMRILWDGFLETSAKVASDKSSYYICSPQGGELMMMMMAIDASDWSLKHTIIWNKNNHVLGRSDYNYKHEPILYGWKKKGTHEFYGNGDKLTSVWDIDKPNNSDLHPTMKPIELVANALKNSSKEENNILDCFGGSGSTLIAAEQTNRNAYLMEIDPKYCDVIRKRYAKFIGRESEWQTL